MTLRKSTEASPQQDLPLRYNVTGPLRDYLYGKDPESDLSYQIRRQKEIRNAALNARAMSLAR